MGTRRVGNRRWSEARAERAPATPGDAPGDLADVLRVLGVAADAMNARLFGGALDPHFQITTPPTGTCHAFGRYWPAGRWRKRSRPQAEVAVFAEGLDRPLADVLLTLLVGLLRHHNASRGIQDASRQGRYLNGEFAKTARDPKIALLVPAQADRRWGFADVTLGEPGTSARDVCDTLVSQLGGALPLARTYQEPAERAVTMHRYACACTPPLKFWAPKATLRMRCEDCGEHAKVTVTKRRGSRARDAS